MNRSHWFLIVVDGPRNALGDDDGDDSGPSDSQGEPEIVIVDAGDDSNSKAEKKKEKSSNKA
jgi:hypothetical protein